MAAKKGKKHPGFKGAQKSIAAKEGIPMANAGAILAAGARKASPAAKKANPRLKKVAAKRKGGKEPGDSKAEERGESKRERAAEKKRGVR